MRARNELTRTARPTGARLPQGQRDLQSTLDQILSAAEFEFATCGFEAARMQDVARRARLSRQTVYTYFADKGTLFQEMYRRLIVRYEEVLLSPNFAEMPPLAALHTYVDGLFWISLDHHGSLAINAWRRGPELAFGQLTPDVTRHAITVLSGILARGEAGGVFRTGNDAETVFSRAMAVCVGSTASAGLMTHIFARDYDSAQALEQWQAFCRDAVATQVLQTGWVAESRPS